jgi:hypothetical protein
MYMLFAVGSGFYTGASILSFLLWKDEQYGLSFLTVLNEAAKRSRTSGSASFSANLGGERFSSRGIFFLVFYSTVGVVVVYNAGLMLEHATSPGATWRYANVYNELLPFFLMHMVLLMHSAVVQTPSRDNQPFHLLVMATRVLAMTTGVNAFVTLSYWMPNLIQAFQGDNAVHAVAQAASFVQASAEVLPNVGSHPRLVEVMVT